MMKMDHKIIVDLIPVNSTVLDLGCGDGELLDTLTREKNVDGRGIELDEQQIYKCVEKGISVFNDDIENGISEYTDKSFDFVILNQSLQQVKRLEFVLQNALRVGKKVIIGLPNFAHINARMQLFFKGRAPVTYGLPYEWYSTPNIHFCSLSDFEIYCRTNDIKLIKKVFISPGRKIIAFTNLFAEIGIFVIEK